MNWKEFKKSVESQGVTDDMKLYRIDVDSDEIDNGDFEVLLNLPDKNGNDVYEGDIIKSRYTDLLYLICFDGRYVGNAITTLRTHIPDISKIDFNYYDVVGIIHEHPEL